MHILPPGFMKIRNYGLLSNRNRNAKLKVCKRLTNTPIFLNVFNSQPVWGGGSHINFTLFSLAFANAFPAFYCFSLALC
jgi:hypothetical protein